MDRGFGLMVISVALIGLIYAHSVGDVPEEGLVGMWVFSEGKGDIVRDVSGNGHDGKILGTKWVQGKSNFALEFGGEPDTVEIPHHEDFDLVTYTAMAWINVPKPTGGWQTVLGKDAPAGQPRNFGIFVDGNDSMLGVNYTTGGQWKTARGTVILTDNQWHHVAATYDGQFLRAYTDGEMQGETAETTPPDHNTDPVRFGRWGAPRGDFIEGVIDEVAIFNKALGVDEIKVAMEGLAPVEVLGKLVTTWAYLRSR